MLRLLLVISCFFSISLYSQSLQLSSKAEVSLITLGPGDALNDTFGHTAFRIKDTSFDYCFDYGRFDFNEPGFYTKFAQGKLNYWLGISRADQFIANYKAQNRTVIEQVLNLTQKEKQALFDFLMWNAKDENKFYLYDFFFDNCASKPRDVINNVLNNSISFELPEGFEQQTFRQLIYSHIHKNSWGSLGIDLGLGSVIDREATIEDHMFLPQYVHDFFEVAKKADGSSLVRTSTTLYDAKNRTAKTNFWLSPLFLFGIIALAILSITYKDFKSNKKSKWLDLSLFLVTGLAGVIIFLLWFATNHTATAYNYNLLWAFPLNLVAIWQLIKIHPSAWFRKYLKLLVILLFLLCLHWIIGVQVFAIGLIPLLLALLVRYLFLIRYYKDY